LKPQLFTPQNKIDVLTHLKEGEDVNSICFSRLTNNFPLNFHLFNTNSPFFTKYLMGFLFFIGLWKIHKTLLTFTCYYLILNGTKFFTYQTRLPFFIDGKTARTLVFIVYRYLLLSGSLQSPYIPPAVGCLKTLR